MSPAFEGTNMCIFCDIIQEKIDTKIIYENDDILAFHDIHPSAPVHILIVSKKHIESVKDMNASSERLLGKMIIAAKIIAADNSLDGYKIVFNVGRGGGQIIDHLHLHLLGGWSGKPEKVVV